MSNLKPCPFCGAKPYISQGETKYYLKHKYECYFYGKHNHDVQLVAFANDSDDIASWNTRPIEDTLHKDISQLQADNRSLVEHMNAMALKPNQEVIEWYQHPLYPETSRCCIVECTDNCFYVAHHSDIDGWLNAATYEQLSNVKSWAYLPIGANHE